METSFEGEAEVKPAAMLTLRKADARELDALGERLERAPRER